MQTIALNCKTRIMRPLKLPAPFIQIIQFIFFCEFFQGLS